MHIEKGLNNPLFRLLDAQLLKYSTTEIVNY
jgi:hypothetical protein